MAKKNIIGDKTQRCESGYPPESVDRIRELAYFIWEKKGKPANAEMENWLEAERELKRAGLI